MTNQLRSPKWMMALSRIKRILSQNGIDFKVSEDWDFTELAILCENIDDAELLHYLAILQVESGVVDANIVSSSAA